MSEVETHVRPNFKRTYAASNCISHKLTVEGY